MLKKKKRSKVLINLINDFTHRFRGHISPLPNWVRNDLEGGEEIKRLTSKLKEAIEAAISYQSFEASPIRDKTCKKKEIIKFWKDQGPNSIKM